MLFSLLTNFSVLWRVPLLSEEAFPEEAAGSREEQRARFQLGPHVLGQRADVVLKLEGKVSYEDRSRSELATSSRIPK